MRLLTYIQYFFFITFNWNIRLALTVIYHEIKGEKKYRIQTSGYDELRHLVKKGIDISHATFYMPAAYNILEDIFTFFSGKNHTHFLDIGCGRGRAMAVAAHYGFNKISGIDISEKLVESATKNMQSVKASIPSIQYFVSTANAADYAIPYDVDIIFLFNPFDKTIMSIVADHILKSIQSSPRRLYIAYENPLYKNIFLQAGFKEIYYTKKMNYLEASIFEWIPKI